MKTDAAGIELIKRFEGVKLRAYRCPAGVLTIGYGSTRAVRPGMVITQAEADARLRDDLSDAEEAVAILIDVPLNPNEHAALVSLVYNIGAGAFGSSTLRRLLNSGDRKGAADQFKRWNKANGNVLKGLVRRRDHETTLFLKPVNADG
jgi:lysozyme